MSYKLIAVFMFVLQYSSLSLASTDIKTVKDLTELKKQAQNSKVPVLLLFSAEECEYCDAIRTHYLKPMQQSEKYKDSILFRQVYIDEFFMIKNFDGHKITGDKLALNFDVDVTPTILFIDATGKEIAERLVGISMVDYFDKLLDMRITSASDIVSKD